MKSSPAPPTGSTSTWARTLVVEIWAPNKEAGITDYKWVDWYRDHPVEDEIKLPEWSDEQCGGKARRLEAVHHPQLGRSRSAAGTA